MDMLFQSTLPIQGATTAIGLRATTEELFQSTLPIQGATVIHKVLIFDSIFQSTLPIQGATEAFRMVIYFHDISIHAPHTGSDRYRLLGLCIAQPFQSTLPIQGATIHQVDSLFRVQDFNPRSPYRERPKVSATIFVDNNFNPRSPYRERLKFPNDHVISTDFNPRSPYRERRIRLQLSSAG